GIDLGVVTNLSRKDRDSAAFTLSGAAARRQGQPVSLCQFQQRPISRRPTQPAVLAAEIDLALTLLASVVPLGRGEAFMKDLKGRDAHGFQALAERAQHLVRAAQVETGATADQCRIDVTGRQPPMRKAGRLLRIWSAIEIPDR